MLKSGVAQPSDSSAPQSVGGTCPEPAGLYELAKTALKAGDTSSALRLCDEALAMDADHAKALYLRAVCLRYEHRFDEAEQCLARLLHRDQDHAAAWQERGHLYRDRNMDDQAVEAYRVALSCNDMLEASWNGLIACCRRTGRNDEAVDAQTKLDSVRMLSRPLRAAVNFMNEGQTQAAEQICNGVLQKEPNDVNAIRLLARIVSESNRYPKAESLLRRCVAQAPKFIAAHVDLLWVLQKRHRYAEALGHSTTLLSSTPDNLSILSLHARALGLVGRDEEAVQIYRRMMALGALDAGVWLSYGHALKTLGRYAEAVAAYQEACRLRPSFGDAYWSLANLKVYRFTTLELEQMEIEERSANLSATDRIHLCFALGKAHEDRKQYRTSFDYYERGNALKRAQLDFDCASITRAVEAQIHFFDEARVRTLEGAGCPAADPIFIVGLPRAGSTLVEQILASHSQVDGTRELPNIIALANQVKRELPAHASDCGAYPECLAALSREQLARLGKEYLDETRIQRQGAPRFVDKMPNNFRHIGLILTILPNARIIDARRHPLACCFSNFKQLFAEGQHFSYSYADLAAYYRDYVRLMAHWDTVYPGRILRVQYEDVVADPESQIRRILDFCSLPYEEACLRFHETNRSVRTASSEQVRRPINADGLAPWKGYECWIEPLAQHLLEAGVNLCEAHGSHA